jgi:hypothetical protein
MAGIKDKVVVITGASSGIGAAETSLGLILSDQFKYGPLQILHPVGFRCF